MTDISIANHGSVVMVHVNTPAAREWVEQNVHTEGWQWMGNAFAAEPRSVEDLTAGMIEAGLTID